MTYSSLIGGKAEGLVTLSALGGINVPEFAVIGADDAEDTVRATVRRFIAENPHVSAVAVRSSALVEDGQKASFAGAFKTILNVPMNEDAMVEAIVDVQQEGHRKLSDVFNMEAQKSVGVVVQRMVDKPDVAGVCLTQGYGAEDRAYMLLNFRNGLGDSLVSGSDSGTQLKVLRSGPFSAETLEKYPFLPDLVKAVKAIEDKMGGRPLDMEFAVQDGKLYMLQMRPFVTPAPASVAQRQQAEQAAQQLQQTVNVIPANDLYCDMTDINPRELLGQNPRQINIDIFRRMFADDVVETARAGVGYDPLHAGLLRQVGPKPYISMRAAAYSFRPQGITDATYDKMADIYREKLLAQPDLQDKVEFDVFVTNAGQLPKFFAQHPHVFTAQEKGEITTAFDRLDARLRHEIQAFCGIYPAQGDALRVAANGLDRNQDQPADVMDALRPDVIDALRQGTSLFVMTARMAFYQKSLCDRLYGEDQVRSFLVSLDTPSERLQRDLYLYALGARSKDDLTREYGHIRPGQMDVTGVPYRQDIDKSLDLARYRAMPRDEAQQNLRDMAQKQQAQKNALAVLPTDQRQNIADLRVLLAAREHVKHTFMRIYDILAEKVQKQAVSTPSAPNAVLLPPVLGAGADLACMPISQANGTYFTQKKVEAMPLVVTDDNLHSLGRADVEGKILIMDHADPGYDFLLLFQPAGVVTRIGGPASHIAVRVNEYGIPACIGCGLDTARVDCTRPYVLDCAAQKNYSVKNYSAAGKDEKPAAKLGKHAPRTP